jgi:hypothetical protein
LVISLAVQIPLLLVPMGTLRDPVMAPALPLLPLPVFAVLMVPVSGVALRSASRVSRPALICYRSVSLLALPLVMRAAVDGLCFAAADRSADLPSAGPNR